MDTKKILAGAASGFLAAFVVDIHAWSASSGPFDWKLAAKRWIGGAVAGVTAAIGISQVPA